MNPITVANARTARLVREATTPVYTTATRPVVREHIMAVEVDSGMGRYWTSMPDSEVDAFIDGLAPSYDLSDIDHSAKCWCQK
jgi:hypothetical protein